MTSGEVEVPASGSRDLTSSAHLEELLSEIRRRRDGFRALAASVDLIGMKDLMVRDRREARQRLDDFQQGFGEALIFWPGGQDYRVCFAGDSVFVVRELQPDEDGAEIWPSFCGHVFALSAHMNEMDRGIGNPGMRVVIAAGPLFQLARPDSWQSLPWRDETKNWFVLTGASLALSKVWEAEQAGARGRFEPLYCWHEQPDEPGHFLGTRLASPSLEYARRPANYPILYRQMVESADRRARLDGWGADQPGT